MGESERIMRGSFKHLSDNDLLNKLASLEHEQWSEWAKSLAKSEKLSEERIKRWEKLWDTPYEELDEKEKESDLKWAKKVLEIINK